MQAFRKEILTLVTSTQQILSNVVSHESYESVDLDGSEDTGT